VPIEKLGSGLVKVWMRDFPAWDLLEPCLDLEKKVSDVYLCRQD
jgi:hypothetical protein